MLTCHTGQLNSKNDNSLLGKMAVFTGASVYGNQSWTFPALILNGFVAGYSTSPKYDKTNRKYAFDNAGDWTLASPDSTAKKGYSIKEIGAVSLKPDGTITTNPNWKGEHVNQYYEKQGWKSTTQIFNRTK